MLQIRLETVPPLSLLSLYPPSSRLCLDATDSPLEAALRSNDTCSLAVLASAGGPSVKHREGGMLGRSAGMKMVVDGGLTSLPSHPLVANHVDHLALLLRPPTENILG